MIFENKVNRHEILFYLIIIPLIGLSVALSNYVLLALAFILAIPLNYLIYKQYKKEDKVQVFMMNKLKALGVGLLFALIFLANMTFEIF